MFVSEIFEPQPLQMGLRGDWVLWDALRDRYRDVPVPHDVDAFEADVRAFIEGLRERNRYHAKLHAVYVQEYGPNKIAHGMVALRYWEETGIPLLALRLEMANERATGGGSAPG